MAKSIDIKINLRKLKSEIMTTKKGTRCVIIPISENRLFESKEGNIYLDLTGWELVDQKVEKNFKNTHMVKQKLSKEVFDKLTDTEKKNMPIFGNVYEYVSQTETPVVSETIQDVEVITDDLPF